MMVIQYICVVLILLQSFTVSFRSFLHGERVLRRNIFSRMSSSDESTHFDYLVVGGGSGGAPVFTSRLLLT